MVPLKAPGIIDPDLNNTLIVIIPKVSNLESFTQFRPISLYYVLYKLVMKEQDGFITGNNIIDNIIIAQEIIHFMRIQNKKKWITIIIDLETAYDRVRWDFINATLLATGIPDYLRKVIMLRGMEFHYLNSGLSEESVRVIHSLPTFLCYAWNDLDILFIQPCPLESGVLYVSLAQGRLSLTCSLPMI
ncbi:reverse transcriptase [Gossypium australe]|uniref:Reverse transcriptase n=1 Tax=Gossypium australe TaxID=47621 RepID=A0A5B6WW71_9ROSI|nr:reverse transcriptase [Gossypium australe]